MIVVSTKLLGNTIPALSKVIPCLVQFKDNPAIKLTPEASVAPWRYAGDVLEVFAEKRLVAEIKFGAYFLYGESGVAQQCLGFDYDVRVYPLAGCAAACLLYGGQINKCDAKNKAAISVYAAELSASVSDDILHMSLHSPDAVSVALH